MKRFPIDQRELLRFIAEIATFGLTGGADAESADLSPHKQVARLQACAEAYLQSHSFRPGDIVQVKPALAAAYQFPAGCPAVVVEDIDPPLIAEDKDPHTSNYGMELDLRILVIVEDAPHNFAVSSALFEPYVEQPDQSEQTQESNDEQASAG